MNNAAEFFQNNPWLLPLILWSIIWKAIALWHAARNSQIVWYIILIIINTAGVLEIIYLLFFRKKRTQYPYY
ncbi:MAG: DUF5652 family protein [Eubacteriales bacterium]